VSLVVLTGAVRSGKSAGAETLAAARGLPVVVAVAGWDGDTEMQRRIAAHQISRPEDWRTMVVGTDPGWISEVPLDTVLLLDCLATLVGTIAWEEVGAAEVADASQEARAARRAEAVVSALAGRGGDTVVVTNEAGWGVIPPTAAGRLFRDVLGRANRMLVEASDVAYLVVAGRFLDLKIVDGVPVWPSE